MFNTDLEMNKNSVEELTMVKSKGVRSCITGYVTHKKSGQGARVQVSRSSL